MCLLLIDTRCDTKWKGGWEERHATLRELVVILLYTVHLREKQDQIADTVACCKEALWVRHEVVSEARNECFVKINTGYN